MILANPMVISNLRKSRSPDRRHKSCTDWRYRPAMAQLSPAPSLLIAREFQCADDIKSQVTFVIVLLSGYGVPSVQKAALRQQALASARESIVSYFIE